LNFPGILFNAGLIASASIKIENSGKSRFGEQYVTHAELLLQLKTWVPEHNSAVVRLRRVELPSNYWRQVILILFQTEFWFY
jgi:hypothetical protein